MSSILQAELADLLRRAADTRTKVMQRTPTANSPAHIDQQGAVHETRTPKVSDRLILIADVYTGVAADQLAALAKLIRDGDSIFPLFPLMRAVVENSVGVIWALDPAVTPQQRWARGALAEYDSVSRDYDMIANWLPKKDAQRVKQLQMRTDLREELEPLFPIAEGLEGEARARYHKLDSRQFALGGEQIPPIEENVSRYLDNPGETLWKGVYGYLCARGTHASLGSARYITGSSLGTGFDLPAARLVWLVRATLSAYGRALEHMVQWCGWDDAPVSELIDEVALLNPENWIDPPADD